MRVCASFSTNYCTISHVWSRNSSQLSICKPAVAAKLVSKDKVRRRVCFYTKALWTPLKLSEATEATEAADPWSRKRDGWKRGEASQHFSRFTGLNLTNTVSEYCSPLLYPIERILSCHERKINVDIEHRSRVFAHSRLKIMSRKTKLPPNSTHNITLIWGRRRRRIFGAGKSVCWPG